MDIRDRRALKDEAAQILSHYPGQKKLLLLWISASTALSVIVSLISLYLDSQIEGTGGLSGIGLRSLLSTLQSALSLGLTIAIPFWTFGYNASILKMARKESAPPATLLQGFRLFGPVLRLTVFQYLIFAGLVTVCIYAGAIVLAFTPLAEPATRFLMENESILLTGVITEEMAWEMLEAMAPVLAGCGVVCLIFIPPVFYKLRLANLCLLDAPQYGAMTALRVSGLLMRKNRFTLFKLDLSFWWFYLAQGLLLALCYADVLLPLLGIPASFDTAASFAFYLASMVLQLVLFYFCHNQVQTTYAVFYDSLRNQPAVQTLFNHNGDTP